jgi:hypothetical protein
MTSYRLHRWLGLAALIVAVATVEGAAGAQTSQAYAGRRVSDVLRQLQREGTNIVFSSSVVLPEMRIEEEPEARSVRQLLRRLLDPHGLQIQDGPGNTLLVVRKPRDKTTPDRRPTPEPARGAQSVVESVAHPSPPAVRHAERVEVQGHDGAPINRPVLFDVRPEQITQTAGAFDNVLQVVQTLPGVVSLADHDNRLSVRGGDPDQNLILLDGVLIHDPYRSGPFSWTTSLFDPATIERVELDPSGLDASHGGRLSSAILIHTRDGTTARRLAGTAAVGLTNAHVALEGRLPRTRSGSWLLSTRGAYHDALLKTLNSRAGAPSFLDLQLKTSFNPTARSRVSLLGLMGRSTVRDDVPREEIGRASTGVIGATWQWAPNNRLMLVTKASGYWQQVGDLNTSQDTGDVHFTRDVDIADVAARQTITARVGSAHMLRGGLELRRVRSRWAMEGRSGAYGILTPGPTIWGARLSTPVDSHLSSSRVAAWVQDRVRLAPDLELQPGLRIDWNSVTGEATPQPRVRIAKRINEDTDVWAGVGWHAQTPAHESMLQGVQFFDIDNAVGSMLMNERMRQAVVGFERRLTPTLTLRAEVYHRVFDRLLVQALETEHERQLRLTAYELPPDLPRDSALLELRPSANPENTGRGRAFGLEILLQRRARFVQDRFAWSISYAFNEAVRDVYGQTIPFDYNRQHMLTMLAVWQATDSLELSATWQLGSGLPITPAVSEVWFQPDSLDTDGDGNRAELRSQRQADGSLVRYPDLEFPRLSLLNSQRLPIYSRVDVRGTYQRPGSRWQYYGEVINLFDRTNSTRAFGGNHRRLPHGGARVSF